MANEKTTIQIGDKVIELKGEELATFLADRKDNEVAVAKRQKQQETKAAARESALAKLAALGLTEAEIAAL